MRKGPEVRQSSEGPTQGACDAMNRGERVARCAKSRYASSVAWFDPRVRMAAAGALALLGACTSYVERGQALYGEGRFVEAAEVFERTENRLKSSTDEERAQYGLYRGVTLLALGDLTRSHRWLSFAYDIERSKPGSLDPEDRALLDQAWDDLSRQLQTAVEPAPQHAVVAAESTAAFRPDVQAAPSSPTDRASQPTLNGAAPAEP
jgi:tetratricopeptide (TPR) repeat protein